MKRFTRILTVALCLTLLMGMMASCGVTLKPGDKGLYDKQNKITYVNASTVYEAVALVEDYGTLSLNKNVSYKIYTVPGTDPKKILATEEFDILHASDVAMPTLEEMMPNVLHVCVDGTTSSSEILRYEDLEGIFSLIDDYCYGDNVTYMGHTPLRQYRVRFESPDYPGFYYTLTYMEYSEDQVIDGVNHGKYFLYSAFENRFVSVEGVIHKALGLE